ncbi:hypothetical protein HNY73_011161 [Argiope bruennichi]|uniref:Uncharacterized protein n=1 Tax=Argiope bruennichi TaxID=94029 RepID=A0A8T0F389_ARGBR|nr:hypothetical protein HNY73_011161 [Argiope bruennichi]
MSKFMLQDVWNLDLNGMAGQEGHPNDFGLAEGYKESFRGPRILAGMNGVKGEEERKRRKIFERNLYHHQLHELHIANMYQIGGK